MSHVFRGAPHAETSSFLNVVIEDDIHLLTIEIEWKGIPMQVTPASLTGVACGILEKMPDIGTAFCHPKCRIVEKDQPVSFYNPNQKWWDKQAVRHLRTDLRHHIGKAPGSYKVARSSIPTIQCDEAGLVRLDTLLNMDVLWSHEQRMLDQPLHAHDAEECKRQLNRSCRYCSTGTASSLEIRLQFLGVRVAEPPKLHGIHGHQLHAQELERKCQVARSSSGKYAPIVPTAKEVRCSRKLGR